MSYVVKKILKKCEKIEETNSEWIVKCPVCGGKLKISKNKSIAYLCVTENCHKDEIKSKLKIQTKNEENEEKDRGKPYPMERDLGWSNSDSIIGIEKDELFKNILFKIDEKNHNKIYYGLDCNYENQIIRYDYENGKSIHPEFRVSYPNLFNENFLKNKYGTVVFLEGEKSAYNFTIYTGLLGLSIPATKWTDDYIHYKLKQLKGNISSILYFPDNDQAGKDKAKQVKKIANEEDIKCKILNPYKKYEFKEGADIMDCLFFDVKYFIMKSL